MRRVRASAPQLAGLVPYDPKYLPARVMLSANENPADVPEEVRLQALAAIAKVPFNRYPDPLANGLRDLVAEANGLARGQVLVGNGGDELLFDVALAWGGPGRTMLTMPPTFSVYGANARLTNTEVVEVARRGDYSIDEDAVLERASRGDIDYVVVGSPGNPTGDLAPEPFVERLLGATDALVIVDEAYFEFSRRTVRPLLSQHENLCVLRTFSKAFSLAGARIGYILANEPVIAELLKVRQPYSVDAVSQAVARVVFENRSRFMPGIDAIIAERSRVFDSLKTLPGVRPYPSDANYILFKVDEAAAVWRRLFDAGVLVRDFSGAPMLEGSLRVTVGSPEENDAFLAALREAVMRR